MFWNLPVTKFPGFARATSATIGERAAGVAAEKFEALEEAGADHAALLERYQQQMEEVSVADRTVLFQAALEEVRAGADFARHPFGSGLLEKRLPSQCPVTSVTAQPECQE